MRRFLICVVVFITLPGFVLSQQKSWHLQDNGYGVALQKVSYLKLDRSPQRVLVAVIDSGLDTLHTDLQGSIWTDPLSGGHGWNFTGSETGREDVTKLVWFSKSFFDSLEHTQIPEKYRDTLARYRSIRTAYYEKYWAMEQLIRDLRVFLASKRNSDSLSEKEQKQIEDANDLIAKAQYHLSHGLNLDNPEVDIAKGDRNIFPDRMAPLNRANPTPMHGTNVAGILSGKSYGVAKNVQVMMLKTNGNIRELRDTNLARAIYYAVDHGARIINMSFGKAYSWNKACVDAAVAYAIKHNVLLIHSAGNNSENIDVTEHYPNPSDKSAWLEVGASDQKGKRAGFSNYGRMEVDLFAPGVDIYAAVPNNEYAFTSGTSMAAPVVSGIAALLMGYYPKLTAKEVKEILLQSVTPSESLKDKCKTGGIVNAAKAFELADKIK